MVRPDISDPKEWANAEVWEGYDWNERPGPYWWQKLGDADILHGLGMPYPPMPWEPQSMHAEGGVHISFFCVWRERFLDDQPEPEPDEGSGCLFSIGNFICKIGNWLK